MKYTIAATVKSKPCKRCGNPVESASNSAKYCNVCKTADPNRHIGRKSRALPEIIVHVDTEGDGKGNITSASYGREDGTSDTIISSDPVEVILWWMDNLSGTYNGQRQIIGAFHFNYDTAVLTKFMDSKAGTLRLIHKAKSRGGLICHRTGGDCQCGKLHAYSRKDTIKVITSGGENDVLTWDKESCIAIAATPRRRFYAEYRPKGFHYNGYTALDIHDMGTAFVGGLERVIDTWQPDLSAAQRAIIAWGKQARKAGFFPDADMAKVAEYSEAECVAAAKCARLLIDTISDAAGITIKANALFGSGSLASAAFRSHGLASNDEIEHDDDIDALAQLTYFGGLIETPVIGVVRGIIHEEDLNSAYPAAMIHLPCMKDGHGHWRKVKRGFRPELYGITENTVGHVLAGWSVETLSTPPFMVRDKSGSVFQPLNGVKTWVTMAEYVNAIKHFKKGIYCNDAIWWEQTCDCLPPLAWLADLYTKRLAIKAEMKQCEKGSDEWQRLNCHQEAIKLVINSCYGKLAQRRPTTGKYTNLHWASHITGSTRAKVRARTWHRESKGSIVVYQHTDSVLTSGKKPSSRETGQALGEWGLEDKDTMDAFILQPGLMTGLKSGKTATRGVGKTEFKQRAEQFGNTHDFSRHPSEWDVLIVPTRRMVTRKQAIARRKPQLAGTFEDKDLELKVSRYKRDLDKAIPVPGQPEAWFVPPVDFVHTATLEDVLKLQEEYTTMEDGSTDGDYEIIGDDSDFDDSDAE